MSRHHTHPRAHLLSGYSAMGLALAIVLEASPALALQPLTDFLDAARRASPDARAAALATVQRDAEALAARGQLLPSIALAGTYTLNQYESVLGSGEEVIVIQPRHSLAGSAQLSVPLIDVAAWHRAWASSALARSARLSEGAVTLAVDRQVAMVYYELIDVEALARAYQSSLEAAEESLAVARGRRDAGGATDLDVARAEVEVDSIKRSIAEQELTSTLARRALKTLTGLQPTPGAPDVADDLHAEAPLADWEARAHGVPAIRAAAATSGAAEETALAARWDFVPRLSAQARVDTSNASGFTGHPTYFTGMLTLSWQLGVPSIALARGTRAAADRARIDEQRAQTDALDQVHEDWQRVRVGIARCLAARSEADAARERYLVGAGTQLDLIQAQRDLAAAEAARITADADLALARVLLRLAVGEL